MSSALRLKAFRYLIRTVFYGALLTLAFWFAFELRMMDADPQAVAAFREARWAYIWWVIPFKLMLLYVAGQFHGLLFYFRMPDAIRVVTTLFVGSIFLLISAHWSDNPAHYLPRSVALIDLNLSILGVCGARILMRYGRERLISDDTGAKRREPTRLAIMGAGDAGAQLAAELLAKPVLGLLPVAFYDDNREKHGLEIHGVPVRGGSEALVADAPKYGFTEVVLAVPSAAVRRTKEIHALVTGAGLKLRVVPSLSELATGRVAATDLREVQIEDLLGREPVSLDDKGILGMIEHRTVLVTGAGGSIGSEICRQVARRSPKRLILLEQCEVLIYQIEQELTRAGFGAVITAVVADVTDAARLEAVFSKYKPEIVVHAAAHKHVPLMESQPGEAVKNNSLGTLTVAEAASRHGVERFTLISTDKAINPTNAMGASKRLAEIGLQCYNGRPGNTTKFMAVRFGNVLGSSGSVIPLFKKQIAAGGPVTVTHPDMTRYFMTIPEACGLVLQATTLGEGGEIFVLDMGEPMKIVDLATQLITLSGLRPGIDILINFSGLRPGEKLYEELKHTGEEFADTKHSRIARFKSTPLPFDRYESYITRLNEITRIEERDRAKLAIRDLVPEYAPYLD